MERTLGTTCIATGRLTLSPAWALTLGLLALVLLRLTLLDDYLAYSGDMASYLMTRNYLLGADPTGYMEAHWRPPIVGALLVPLTWAFGDLLGSKLLALLSSVVVAGGFYAFARIWLRPWWAVAAAWAFALHPMVADYTVGGYLPLLALALTLLALRWLHDALHRQRPLWLPAIAVFLLVGLNQTAPPIWALAALLMVAETPGARRRGLLALGLAVLVSLAWYYPFYSNGVPLSGSPMTSPNMGLLVPQVSPTRLLNGLIGVGAIALMPVQLRYRALPAGLFLATSLMGAADIALNNVLARTGQMVVVYGVVGVAVALQGWSDRLRLSWPRTVQGAGLAGLALMALFLSSLAWSHQFHFYATRGDTLTPDRLATVRWIGDSTPWTARVYAHPRGLGYYIGGLAPRAWDAPFPVPLVGREAQHAAYRCALGWDAGCNPYSLRDDYGVDYIALDESAWEQIADTPADGWPRTATSPWLRLEHEEGPVKVYGWQ